MRRNHRLPLAALVLLVAATACSGSEAADPTTTTLAVQPPTTTATTNPPVTTTTGVGTTATTAGPEDTTTTSTTLAPSMTTTVAPTTTEDPASKVTIVAIAVADGEVVEGEEVVEIARGSAVELIITADISDEVHLHGYNIFADVAPDAPASISFVADIPGIFEVELEGFGLLLVELEIS